MGIRGERRAPAVVIISAASIALAWSSAAQLLSTKPGLGVAPYFKEVFIQEQEKNGMSLF